VTVTAWSDVKGDKVVDTIHGHTSKRADVLDSMEDAAQEALERVSVGEMCVVGWENVWRRWIKT
jgi:hypothetical protein